MAYYTQPEYCTCTPYCPAKGKGRRVRGSRYRANCGGLHCAYTKQHSGTIYQAGVGGNQAVLAGSGKDPALALSLAGFGRMTAWRQGSFVKAAAHFERATTCLTRSLSMFRLVGVGSRPDLLAVVVCAKSTKLAVTLAQGIGCTQTHYSTTSSGPLSGAEPSTQGLAVLICTGARPLSGRGGG